MKRFAMLLILFPTAALSQQLPDPALLQKAIAVLQQQRNQAMDAAASAETNVAALTEENKKLKDEIDGLKKDGTHKTVSGNN